MRETAKEPDFAFNRIYNQLQRMDFNNFICSPLINGGCGLGKTTALTDERMYELFKEKLNKANPHILFIESRSVTRDQLRDKHINPNYVFLQFAAASTVDLTQFDIIVIDEAHSLFVDSDFAARQMEPLARWLRESKCFQIYITASDIEFLGFANTYFQNREFSLTFPDLENLHVRFLAEQMILSINSKKLDRVIKIKEKDFFTLGKKGIFFTLSAQDAMNLRDYYTEMGYKCAFYISQQNSTKVSTDISVEEEDRTILDYTSLTKTISLIDYFHTEEKRRTAQGLPTIRESLIAGKMPPDIDYLFITDTGREGLDIKEGQLDFIFIEDTIPLTINQKIYRYRGNIPLVYISLPQRRLEKIYINSIKQVQELMNESQDYLRGYYKGSGSKKGKNSLEQIIVYNEKEDKYEVSQLYLSKLLFYTKEFNEIRENVKDTQFLREKYGTQAEKFLVEDLNEVNRKNILTDFFKDKIGLIITKEMKEQFVRELKEKGLTNEKQNKDFSFEMVIQYCKKYNICTFKKKRATKKDIKKNSNLIYRNVYLMVDELTVS